MGKMARFGRLCKACLALLLIFSLGSGSRKFDGVNDILGPENARPYSALPVTACAWIQYQLAKSTGVVIAFYSDADAFKKLWISVAHNGDDSYSVSVCSQGSFSSSSCASYNSGGIPYGVWHHVCGQWVSNSERHVWVDGVLEDSDTTSVNAGVLNRTVVGRKGAAPTNFYDSVIAQLAVWDDELSEGEIVGLSQGANPMGVGPTDLVAYWPLWGLDSEEIDLSGQFGSLTVDGATVHESGPPVLLPSVDGSMGGFGR